MARGGKQDELLGLIELTSSTQALVAQFLSALTASDSSTPLPAEPPHPLHVLRDAALLLKAQTTKLGLLLLNKPFTPSAISKIIRDITSTCLPAMMSAVEICKPDIWGRLLRQEAQARVRTVMREMQVCFDEVLELARAEQDVGRPKNITSTQGNSRDSLASTGVVWHACDAVVQLESLGIGGLAVQKAEQYRDMLKDAIEELKEWAEDDEDEDGDDDFACSDDDDEDDKDSVDDLFSAANKLPKDRKDLRDQLAQALDKLKKVGMLYAALSKRRLKTFTPALAGWKLHVKTLDGLLDALKELPDTVDELASAFYDLDAGEIRGVLEILIDQAQGAALLVKLGWDGKEDEFTSWSAKWSEAIK